MPVNPYLQRKANPKIGPPPNSLFRRSAARTSASHPPPPVLPTIATTFQPSGYQPSSPASPPLRDRSNLSTSSPRPSAGPKRTSASSTLSRSTRQLSEAEEQQPVAGSSRQTRRDESSPNSQELQASRFGIFSGIFTKRKLKRDRQPSSNSSRVGDRTPAARPGQPVPASQENDWASRHTSRRQHDKGRDHQDESLAPASSQSALVPPDPQRATRAETLRSAISTGKALGSSVSETSGDAEDAPSRHTSTEAAAPPADVPRNTSSSISGRLRKRVAKTYGKKSKVVVPQAPQQVQPKALDLTWGGVYRKDSYLPETKLWPRQEPRGWPQWLKPDFDNQCRVRGKYDDDLLPGIETVPTVVLDTFLRNAKYVKDNVVGNRSHARYTGLLFAMGQHFLDNLPTLLQCSFPASHIASGWDLVRSRIDTDLLEDESRYSQVISVSTSNVETAFGIDLGNVIHFDPSIGTTKPRHYRYHARSGMQIAILLRTWLQAYGLSRYLPEVEPFLFRLETAVVFKT